MQVLQDLGAWHQPHELPEDGKIASVGQDETGPDMTDSYLREIVGMPGKCGFLS